MKFNLKRIYVKVSDTEFIIYTKNTGNNELGIVGSIINSVTEFTGDKILYIQNDHITEVKLYTGYELDYAGMSVNNSDPIDWLLLDPDVVSVVTLYNGESYITALNKMDRVIKRYGFLDMYTFDILNVKKYIEGIVKKNIRTWGDYLD